MSRVAIIGAGNVGSSIAYALTIRESTDEIILIDQDDNRAICEALDIQHGIANMGESRIIAGDYSYCKDSDIIIVTAGRGRNNGETRLDLANNNINIVDNIVDKLKPHYRNSIIIIVSNPVDILTYRFEKSMGLPDGKIFGTGNILDTSRLTKIIADHTKTSCNNVEAHVIGEHGDGQIPVWSKLSVNREPIQKYCETHSIKWDNAEIKGIESTLKELGATIIKGKGKTNYGIATCVCYLVESILNKREITAPVTSTLKGEYGIVDVALSILSIIDSKGIKQRIEEQLSESESDQLKQTANKLRNFMRSMNI